MAVAPGECNCNGCGKSMELISTIKKGRVRSDVHLCIKCGTIANTLTKFAKKSPKKEGDK